MCAMRRNDREITDVAVMNSIVAEAEFCRVAMCDGNQPYVVPLCFGFEDGLVYVHSAPAGRKLEILRSNSAVHVEFTGRCRFVEDPVACKWRLEYRCVMARGRAAALETRDEKRRALGIIMSHYSHGTFAMLDREIDAVAVLKITLDTMTCKISA